MELNLPDVAEGITLDTTTTMEDPPR